MHDDDDYTGESGPYSPVAILVIALMWAAGIIIGACMLFGAARGIG